MREYLAGELCVFVGRLEVVAPTRLWVNDLAGLCREAGTRRLTALSWLAEGGRGVTDRLWWDTLQRGVSAAFVSQTEMCAELDEFGVCAGLLEDPGSNLQGG